MAPHALTGKRRSATERVRARILTALHLGRLRAGDRVASVRRLAGLTGMNPKTIHRAYTALAREGLLEVKRGGGTYVSERATGSSDLPDAHRLIKAINRLRADAAGLEIPPSTLARALTAFFEDGLSGLPVVVTECNGEQLGLIERDLVSGVGVSPRPVPLSRLKSEPLRALGGVRHVVTTNCHLDEVRSVVRPLDVTVHAVSLDSKFPARIAHHASRAPGIMVVRDKSFKPVFLKLLEQMSVPETDRSRIVFVSPVEAGRALREADSDCWLHLSPLVEREMATYPTGALRQVSGAWRVRGEALERLRARLAVELAASDGSAAAGPVSRAG